MLMDWVKSPNKSLSFGATIQEFKRRCAQPSPLKKVMLNSSKVLLILKWWIQETKETLVFFWKKKMVLFHIGERLREHLGNTKNVINRIMSQVKFNSNSY